MSPRTQAAARRMEEDRLPDWKLAYSVDELCAATSYGKTSIWERISDGRLPAHKDGDKVLILREDAQAFLRSLPRFQPTKLRAAG